ncbi:collagen alpha-1(I) chain-like [Esox lucius]|uniref:collagen alpha-1(I) chain-like n=1 Tax=Esox lucius TaxID=8010 RepID=UPI0014773062|nr:collagen alpha-1(I) chain-like [Esox lucius]
MATTTAAASSGGPGTVGSVNHLASVPRHPHPGPSESMKVAVLRSGHTTERIEAHEEISFAYQRSREKECNVCLEVVLDKDIPKERRFGILTKCRHCYCLRCIRSWRASRYNETAKLCPVCRTRSPFFVPSDYWVDDIYEKRKLIKKYKAGMARKRCRHFAQGQGFCQFGDRCFYKHEPRYAYPPEYMPTWASEHPGMRGPWQGSPPGATWGSEHPGMRGPWQGSPPGATWGSEHTGMRGPWQGSPPGATWGSEHPGMRGPWQGSPPGATWGSEHPGMRGPWQGSPPGATWGSEHPGMRGPWQGSPPGATWGSEHPGMRGPWQGSPPGATWGSEHPGMRGPWQGSPPGATWGSEHPGMRGPWQGSPPGATWGSEHPGMRGPWQGSPPGVYQEMLLGLLRDER